MYRDERIECMDEQNLERMFIYPTIGFSCEHLFVDDWDLLYDFFHAFNAWVDEDWGFNYQNRIYSPPLIPMADVHRSRRRAGVGHREGRPPRHHDPRPLVWPFACRLVLRSVLEAGQRREAGRDLPRLRRRPRGRTRSFYREVVGQAAGHESGAQPDADERHPAVSPARSWTR